jgi:anti-sigma factor ChrR (cupin superfamily)
MQPLHMECVVCATVTEDDGAFDECCMERMMPVTVIPCAKGDACDDVHHHHGVDAHTYGPGVRVPSMFPQTRLDKPCDACPFVKESIKGWLGPWTPEDMHRSVMAEQPFPCHKTIDHDGQEFEETELCVGATMYATNCGKQFRADDLEEQRARHQDKAKETCMGMELLAYHKLED